MFVSFFQTQHPQPSVYMRCQLQRRILCKFEYLASLQAIASAPRDLLDEVTRLVYIEPELVGSNITSEPQNPGIAAGIQDFVTLISEVSLRGAFRMSLNNYSRSGHTFVL